MLYDHLIQIGQRLERRASAAAANIAGLSYSETRLLEALEQGPQTRAALAQNVSLTPSAVSRALRPLEKLGFVTSTRSGRDARQSHAQLTPAGKERLGHAQGAIEEAWQSLDLDTGALSPADLKAILSQLQAPRPPHFGNRPRG